MRPELRALSATDCRVSEPAESSNQSAEACAVPAYPQDGVGSVPAYPQVGVGSMRKRVLDFLVALLLVIILAPLFLACALAIKVTSRGPVLFAHERRGFRDRPFRCLKFRTMVRNAGDILKADGELLAIYRENGYKVPRGRDPRVTRVGHFLRYWHLDELPQLLNVLKGDMSLVGPRPIVEEELRLYEGRRDELLSVRPGIFGLWTAQGSGRCGYPERVEVELEYVRTRSFFGDVWILARNLPVLIWGQTDD